MLYFQGVEVVNLVFAVQVGEIEAKHDTVIALGLAGMTFGLMPEQMAPQHMLRLLDDASSRVLGLALADGVRSTSNQGCRGTGCNIGKPPRAG
jgi:hypothetical protein